MQGRPKEGAARWAGVVSAVNALGDGKRTSFSLRHGTKEEKELLDKVFGVALLPRCISCLSTMGSLGSDSCALEPIGRRLARKRRQRPRQPSYIVAGGNARLRTLNKLPRLAVSCFRVMTLRGRMMPGWLNLQLPCAGSVLARHNFGAFTFPANDSMVFDLQVFCHLSLVCIFEHTCS